MLSSSRNAIPLPRLMSTLSAEYATLVLCVRRFLSRELLQSETAALGLWIQPCPGVHGGVVWFTSRRVSLPADGILRKSQSDENDFCPVLEWELCHSEARNKQLIITWAVQKAELVADGDDGVESVKHLVKGQRKWRLKDCVKAVEEKLIFRCVLDLLFSSLFAKGEAKRFHWSKEHYPGFQKHLPSSFLSFSPVTALSPSYCQSDLPLTVSSFCSQLIPWLLWLACGEATVYFLMLFVSSMLSSSHLQLHSSLSIHTQRCYLSTKPKTTTL